MRKKGIPFVLLNYTVLRPETNTKRLIDFLFDADNKLSDPIDRILVRSESRFLNDIHNQGQMLYESY